MTKHVVFVGLDGAQYSELLQLGQNGITNLDHLEAYAGGVQGTATQQGTVSGPGWSTLLTGVWANQHGITGNSNSPINPAVQSLFERIDGAIPDAKIASIVHWGDINTGHFGDETGLRDGTSIVDYEAHGLSDAAVTQRGVDLIKTEAPNFTFLHLDDPDGVGHSLGFGDAYDQELRTAADQVNDIMIAVAERQAANPDEEWMVIVSTDHGRDANGFGHGGQSAGERQILIASNVAISSNGAAAQTSVAATILDFLDIDATGVAGPSLLDEDATDTSAPYLLEARGDDLQTMPVDAPLTLILSERVQKGEGAITIHRASDGAIVQTIDVNSDQVGISAGLVTVHLSAPLAIGTEYYVNVDAGAFVDFATSGNEPVRLFSENFEELADDLQGYVSATEKKDADTTDWTANAPDGWTINNGTTPRGTMSGGSAAGGPQEFYGWTFHDKNAWIDTAYNQNRSQFTKGQGVVAVADPDEYDDITASSGGGTSGILANGGYKTLLTTSAINVAGLVDNKATLTFDSSWRQETYQEARVIVTFDNGQTVELMHWNSGRAGAGGVFKADATNETVTLTIDIPEGATTATIGFDMVNAGNNWWWAIDNIAVDALRPSANEGNPFAGINDATTWNFKTSSDTPLPQIVSVTPADEAGNVAPGAPLVITFDEAVRAGDGSVVIHRADGSVVETISVGSDRVSVDGAVVTVQTAGLAYGSEYYVTIDAGAFRDFDTAQGSAFEGLADATGWNFTTEADTYGPDVAGLTPADEAGNIAPNAPLVITFDEAVRKGAGSIVLHRADGSVLETIDVASDAVALDGKTVTIQPATALAAGGYYVTVTAGAFEDLALHTEKVLFSENFEELTPLLHSYSSPTEVVDGDPTDWTATLPEGWSHVNGTPAGGPQEFFGWTFHDKDAWTQTAGDQGRSGFTKGQGVVAVADGDEYDDGRSIGPNLYRTLLRTSDFGVAGLQDNKATLTFDSSWLPEAPQEVRLVVTFDNGATAELLHWNSTSGSPFYKGPATNETVTLTIDIPQGATKANIAFDMMQSGNNWWWALDNISVTGHTPEPHGNAFAGISGSTAWNFTVEDQGPVGTPGDDELVGTAGADEILAGLGDDTVSAGAGDDSVDGGEGDDTLAGEDGNDLLKGGAGDDALFGGSGNDVLIGGAGDDLLDGGAGVDTVDYSGDISGIMVDLSAGTAEGEAIGADELVDIENVIGGAGNDILIGDDGDNLFVGGAGNDTIDGGAGFDTLDLSAATGAISVDITRGMVSGAGIGTDSFSNIEKLLFGAGNDVVTGGNGNEAFDGGAGNDTLKGGAGDDSLAGGDGDDLLDGGSGDDSVNGGNGVDTIKAGSGNDAIDAGAGNDNVDAGSGDDTILAGAGNDVVDAGSGDDRITGGAGDDTLTGGSGHDAFVFAVGFGKDTIADFKTTGSSSDVLEFASDIFAGFTEAMDAAHQLGADTVFTIDADTSLTLKGVQLASLAQDDFRFV
ncbi:Ig-like domain-containing protein [Bosea sp. BK604]|uniref:Ig-like domain-containing protein n=1 Tax=Bosea sp. BK604 TaxID=2512180 RepID=UPI0010EACFDD|nr:Ig-like domain-containing protein [Bosea sp. BK604]TCR68333.1 Ca2+-binding RTX toxin-like protein [Bosea sp. BK604]